MEQAVQNRRLQGIGHFAGIAEGCDVFGDAEAEAPDHAGDDDSGKAHQVRHVPLGDDAVVEHRVERRKQQARLGDKKHADQRHGKVLHAHLPQGEARHASEIDALLRKAFLDLIGLVVEPLFQARRKAFRLTGRRVKNPFPAEGVGEDHERRSALPQETQKRIHLCFPKLLREYHLPAGGSGEPRRVKHVVALRAGFLQCLIRDQADALPPEQDLQRAIQRVALFPSGLLGVVAERAEHAPPVFFLPLAAFLKPVPDFFLFPDALLLRKLGKFPAERRRDLRVVLRKLQADLRRKPSLFRGQALCFRKLRFIRRDKQEALSLCTGDRVPGVQLCQEQHPCRLSVKQENKHAAFFYRAGIGRCFHDLFFTAAQLHHVCCSVRVRPRAPFLRNDSIRLFRPVPGVSGTVPPGSSGPHACRPGRSFPCP